MMQNTQTISRVVEAKYEEFLRRAIRFQREVTDMIEDIDEVYWEARKYDEVDDMIEVWGDIMDKVDALYGAIEDVVKEDEEP